MIVPNGEYIVIRKETGEKKTKSGIIIEASDVKRDGMIVIAHKATIEAVGGDCPKNLKKGQVIIYNPYDMFDNTEDDTLCLIHSKHVLAFVV